MGEDITVHRRGIKGISKSDIKVTMHANTLRFDKFKYTENLNIKKRKGKEEKMAGGVS